MHKPMKRALIAFLITSALGLIALIVVARTAWRYGDTPGGTAAGKIAIDQDVDCFAGRFVLFFQYHGEITGWFAVPVTP